MTEKIRVFFYRIKLIFDKLTKGYNDLDVGDLDCSISRFILPRLKDFKEKVKNEHPSSLKSNKEWQEVLDKMIYAFENYDNVYSEEDENVQEGLKLFFKHYDDLWY